MFKLIEAFLGVMLFLFLGGLLVLKNQEKHYAFKTAMNYELPDAFLAEELKIEKATQSLAPYFPWDIQINTRQTSFDSYSTSISIKDEYYGDHAVGFRLDTLQKRIMLKAEGEKNVLLRLYWMFNTAKVNKTQRSFPKLLKEKLNRAEEKFNTHRTQWKGIQFSDPIYYLALEKSWDTIPDQKTVALAHQELKAFALERQIPALGEVFTVYPFTTEKKIWRFALPVRRYYATKSKTIRCRRYRGGNSIRLTHKGTSNNLDKSWSQLQDSLAQRGYTLAYPPMERYPINRKNENNPYKWETELILAIKEE